MMGEDSFLWYNVDAGRAMIYCWLSLRKLGVDLKNNTTVSYML
jgi:hypothetical protein